MVNTNAMLYGMMAGQQVGQYHLESLLGAGGFGGVFRANEVVRDRVLRQVAVKVIPGNDEQQLEELLAAATLEHDHLVRCYAAGECSLLNIEALYLAMELAEGSLDSHLQGKSLETEEIRQTIGDVASGLSYLHSQNQVHRDLKPANVLRVKGRWKLSDFGLVRRLGTDSYAQTANPIGTIAYMPPEAFEGKISAAWDMWSLGIIVVQMLSANLPYRFSEPTQLLKRVMNGELQLPTLPEEFRAIVEGCLQVHRGDRWTAEQVLGTLNPLETSTVTNEIGHQKPKKERKPVKETFAPSPKKQAIVTQSAQPKFTPSGTVLETYTENLICQAGGILGLGKKMMEVKLEMVKLSNGQFIMGASDNDSNARDLEKPQHLVTVKAFGVGKYPITQVQYQVVMGKNPANFKGRPNNPVESISWYDAQKFCQRLSQVTGKKYRLPSEAEWEYACRAGTTTRYYFGDNSDQLGDYAWFRTNSDNRTHPVGEKRPNRWGLYDMHGNVWEWCEDSWHDNYRKAPTNEKPWIQDKDIVKVVRGGSWSYSSEFHRSSYRIAINPSSRNVQCSFRVVLSL